jgi:hypothetical protein
MGGSNTTVGYCTLSASLISGSSSYIFGLPGEILTKAPTVTYIQDYEYHVFTVTGGKMMPQDLLSTMSFSPRIIHSWPTILLLAVRLHENRTADESYTRFHGCVLSWMKVSISLLRGRSPEYIIDLCCTSCSPHYQKRHCEAGSGGLCSASKVSLV